MSFPLCGEPRNCGPNVVDTYAPSGDSATSPGAVSKAIGAKVALVALGLPLVG